MELTKVEALLEKYFEGQTTLGEENMLKFYFTKEELPEHLEVYKSMFRYYDEQVIETIIRNNSISLPPKLKLKKLWIQVGIAASIVFIIGVFVNDKYAYEDLGTYKDPKVALKETKKILYMVSSLINKGQKNLVHLNEFKSASGYLIPLNELNKSKNSILKK